MPAPVDPIATRRQAFATPFLLTGLPMYLPTWLRRGLACTFVLCAVAGVGRAQNAPIEWGEIPAEHLQMADFPADSNAAAVILADYGEVTVEDNGQVIYRVHRRIKILDEAGYDWGDVSIPYYAKDRAQRVSRVAGQTFVPGPDGEAERHKMSKKAVFKEDVDGNWGRVRFTLPALAPGAVIEYRYRVISDSPVFLPEWTFQHDEPTLWSEYRLDISRRFNYMRALHGRHRFAVEEVETPIADGRRIQARYVMESLPALREEPYMTTANDYRSRMEMQLSSYHQPGHGMVPFLKSWNELADELLSMGSFGRQIDPNRAVRAQAEALVTGLAPRDQVTTLYDFVRRTVEWDGGYGVFADQDVDDVLESKRGSAPDINLLLVSLLRAAGQEAHPVLVSTRAHGQVVELYPLVNQFNYVLAAVEVGGEWWLLDATDDERPHDLLPVRALNSKGWLVREGNPAWIPVTAGGTYEHAVAIQATLSPDGRVQGTLQTSDRGYSAMFKRASLAEDDDETFVRDAFFDGAEDAELSGVVVEQEDVVTEPLKTEAQFALQAAQVAGDFMYLNPQLVDRNHENPLRLPERTFPVDMAYPRDYIYSLRLTLPDGYEVQEVPGSRHLTLGNTGKGLYQRSMRVVGGVLMVQGRFVLAQSVYDTDQYDALRELFAQVVASQAEQLVLRRVADAPEAAPEPAAPAPAGTDAGGR